MKIKNADVSDLFDTFDWYNDSLGCQNSIANRDGNRKITLAEYQKWFENSLINPLGKIYIGTVKGQKVGVCCFDKDIAMTSAEVSIRLSPQIQERNLAYELLAYAIETYKKSNLVELKATIQKENSMCLNIFLKSGFSIVDEDKTNYYLKQEELLASAEINSKKIALEKVIGSENQIKVLFQLLKKRKYNISNTSLTTFNSHIDFVKNHPYRFWYLIKIDGVYIGSAYVMKNNCVGISLIHEVSSFSQVAKLILKKHKPLKEIKSVRPPSFYINIAPDNEQIELQLIKLGAKKIQLTYSLASINTLNEGN